jgi:hypothetical protein
MHLSVYRQSGLEIARHGSRRLTIGESGQVLTGSALLAQKCRLLDPLNARQHRLVRDAKITRDGSETIVLRPSRNVRPMLAWDARCFNDCRVASDSGASPGAQQSLRVQEGDQWLSENIDLAEASGIASVFSALTPD